MRKQERLIELAWVISDIADVSLCGSGPIGRWDFKCTRAGSIVSFPVTGANPGPRLISGRLSTATDELWQGRNEALTGAIEPAAEIVPERDVWTPPWMQGEK